MQVHAIAQRLLEQPPPSFNLPREGAKGSACGTMGSEFLFAALASMVFGDAGKHGHSTNSLTHLLTHSLAQTHSSVYTLAVKWLTKRK